MQLAIAVDINDPILHGIEVALLDFAGSRVLPNHI